MSLCPHCKAVPHGKYALCMRCVNWCCRCTVECSEVKRKTEQKLNEAVSSWNQSCAAEMLSLSTSSLRCYASTPPPDIDLFFEWEDE